MSLIEAGCFKRITASGGGTLTPPGDESWIVRNLHCVPSSNDTYLTLAVGGRTVNKIRVKGKAGNHLGYPGAKTAYAYEAVPRTLFDFARSLGRPIDIPVAADEIFSVARYAETGDVTVVYDRMAVGDAKKEDVNGSMSKLLRYIHYFENAAAVTTATLTLATSLMFTGGPAWPLDATSLGDGLKMRLLAILGSPVAHGNNTINKGCTSYLSLLLRGNYLKDSADSLGWPFGGLIATTADAETYGGAYSVIGPGTSEDPHPPYVFDPVLEFGKGDSLTTQLSFSAYSAAGIGASGIDLAFLMEQEFAA